MLTPAALPGGVAGNAYSQAITASGGVGPYTFAVTVCSLPAGLNLASNGTLSGTPTASGTFNVTVTPTAANSQTAEPANTLTIAVATPSVPPPPVPPRPTGFSASPDLSTGRGSAPNSLPPGSRPRTPPQRRN